MPDCPSRDKLLAMLAVSDADQATLRAHVESCDDCRERVARLIGVMRSSAQCEAFLSGAADDMPGEMANRILASLQPFFDSAVVGRHHCPSKDLILAMVIEEAAVTDEVSTHVQQCAHCQRDIPNIKGLQFVALAYDTFMSGKNESLPAEVSQRVFSRVDAAYQREIGRLPDCPPRAELHRMLAGEQVTPAVRAHSRQCSACRQVLSSLLATTSLAAGAEAFDSEVGEKIPSNVAQRIFDQLTESGEFPSASRQPAEPASCPDIDALIESLTAPEEPLAIRDHVAKCQHCRGRMAKLLSIFDVASQLETFGTASNDEIPSDVDDRLFSTLSREHDKLSPVLDQGPPDVFTSLPRPAIDNAVTPRAAPTTFAGRSLKILRDLVPYSSCACLLIAVGLYVPQVSTTPRRATEPLSSRKAHRAETKHRRHDRDQLEVVANDLEKLNKEPVFIVESDRPSKDDRSNGGEYVRRIDADREAVIDEASHDRSLPEEFRVDVRRAEKDCVTLVSDASVGKSDMDLEKTVKSVQAMRDWVLNVSIRTHSKAAMGHSVDERREYGKLWKSIVGNPPIRPNETSKPSASTMALIDQPEHRAHDRGRDGAEHRGTTDDT